MLGLPRASLGGPESRQRRAPVRGSARLQPLGAFSRSGPWGFGCWEAGVCFGRGTGGWQWLVADFHISSTSFSLLGAAAPVLRPVSV